MSTHAANPAPDATDAHDAHDAHGHPHNPHLAHHFQTLDQQFSASKLGMWTFLATEILMFGGLFVLYSIFRANHPDVYLYAHSALNTNWGAINTAILLASSFTMAWGVRAAQLSQRGLQLILIALTFFGGVGFMVIKAIEYNEKIKHTLWIGKDNAFNRTTMTAEMRQLGFGYIDDHHYHHAGLTPPGHGDVHNAGVTGGQGASTGDSGQHTGPATPVSPTTHSVNPTAQEPSSGHSDSNAHRNTASGVEPTSPAVHDSPPAARPSAAAGSQALPAWMLLDVPMAAQNAPENIKRVAVVDALKPPAAVPAGTSSADPHLILTYADLKPFDQTRVLQFFSIYYMMTGLHGLHVVVGMGILAWLWVRAYLGHFSADYYTPVDLGGLYWHLVDLIWIFLFPLLYLIH